MSDLSAPDSLQTSEAELARQWKQECAKQARFVKHQRLAGAAVLALIAVILFCFGFSAWALIVVGCGAVAFVMYLDANGHEQEILERSSHKLVPGFHRVFGSDGRRQERESRE